MSSYPLPSVNFPLGSYLPPHFTCSEPSDVKNQSNPHFADGDVKHQSKSHLVDGDVKNQLNSHFTDGDVKNQSNSHFADGETQNSSIVSSGAILELIHPHHLHSIHAAVVSDIMPGGRVRIAFDAESEDGELVRSYYVTQWGDGKLLEAGFCKKFGIPLHPLSYGSLDKKNVTETSKDLEKETKDDKSMIDLEKETKDDKSMIDLEKETKDNKSMIDLEKETKDNKSMIDLEKETKDDKSMIDLEKETKDNKSMIDLEKETKDNKSMIDLEKETKDNKSMIVTKSNGFSWDDEAFAACTKAMMTRKNIDTLSEFSLDQKLEVIHPYHPDLLCVCSVKKITGNILWVCLDGDDFSDTELDDFSLNSFALGSYHENCSLSKIDINDPSKPSTVLNCLLEKKTKVIAVSADSDTLFPVGWAQSHGITLCIPFSCDSNKICNIGSNIDKICNVGSNIDKVCDIVSNIDENMEISSDCKSNRGLLDTSISLPIESRWCPEMILNYRCFPGPFVSRSKLASQIGVAVAGPVQSVLAQVVSQSLAAGFCQSKLSKDLSSALQETSKDRKNWDLLPIKAKCKRFSVRSIIMAPTVMSEVPLFLEKLYSVLQCCKNLWSFSKRLV